MTALIRELSTTNAPLDLVAVDDAAYAYARAAADDGPGDARRRLRDDLVRRALPFAARLARRYRGRGEPLDDLEQVARLALVRAIDRYDPERGPFTGYVAATVTGELRRHFRDTTWGVHVPRRMQELSIQVSRATADLTAELARRPTVDELAVRVGITDAEVRTAIATGAAYLPVSLNLPVGVEGTTELGGLIGHADVGIDAVDDRLTVAALLCRLPVRERQLLALRFYGNRTQVQIAAELGISQMHVSRLLSRALGSLREAMVGDAPAQWRPVRPLAAGQTLAVHTRVAGGTTVVEVLGEVDRDTAGRLRDRLLEAVDRASGEVRVDLSRVPLMDAAGAAVVVQARRAAHRRGVRLQLVEVQRYVRHVLLLAGVRLPAEPPAD